MAAQYFALGNHGLEARGASFQVFPVFSLILFPCIAILGAIVSAILDLSILGILAIIINVIAIVVGKNALPIVYKIISKTL